MALGLDEEDHRARARRCALRAGATATRALDESTTLSVSVLVGQIRSMAVDVLSGLGEEPEQARFAVREAADVR